MTVTRARVAIVAAVALVGLAVASQLALPRLAERGIEDRLTAGGGVAEVSVKAWPAVRLLFDDGERFEVRGSGLDLDVPEERIGILSKLDGFGDVTVLLEDVHAGPLEVASFALVREGSTPYTLRTSATTSGADLLEFGTEQLGFDAGAPIVGFLAGRSPDVARPIPIELDMQLISDDGRLRVVEGGGTIAGYPTGPLAELIVAAIVVRL